VVDLLKSQAVVTQDGIRIDLTWQARQSLENTTIFVHLVDQQGSLVGQSDGEALGGSYPFELWAAGDQVMDTRWIKTDSTGPFGIRVGLYNRQTSERLGAFTGDDEQFPDDSVPVDLQSEQP
jgi:hypothetical protein